MKKLYGFISLICFLMLLGTAGASDNDLISLNQTIIQAGFLGTLMTWFARLASK